VLAAVAGAAVLAASLRAGDPPAAPRRPAALPTAPAAAFQVGPPVALERNAHATTWAAVRRDAVARVRPDASARAVAALAARTPEDTTNIVPTLARARDAHRRLWVRVRLPVLPNGTAGWVPRAALGTYGAARTRLVVDLARRTATLLRDGRRLLRVPVGIGTPAAPTPTGEFVIRNRLARYRSAFYGPVALGTSARSATLTDWPGGGFVGIHGTDRPDLLPGRVSHGCIRMRNADILRVARLAPVGTSLTIH
jgi:lipoprotein-anchoring transpeptidase ErfK/SrfK